VPRVTVGPLPPWIPIERLLGPAGWLLRDAPDGVWAEAELPVAAAADLEAGMRGLGFGGLPTRASFEPPLPRAAVRAGRLREARARRDTSAGFSHPNARLDEEGRRSLTPEALALQIGERAAGRTVLDLCCGAGGDAIGFARAGCPVTAVELDAGRLDLARHNANLYGVARRITFVHGDARELIARAAADLCFVDPPWGGYDKRRSTLDDIPLLREILPHLGRFPAAWLKLPPSFDVATLGTPCEVEPLFGVAPGDRRRVKLLLVALSPATPGSRRRPDRQG
jgi:hypothetical protein